MRVPITSVDIFATPAEVNAEITKMIENAVDKLARNYYRTFYEYLIGGERFAPAHEAAARAAGLPSLITLGEGKDV